MPMVGDCGLWTNFKVDIKPTKQKRIQKLIQYNLEVMHKQLLLADVFESDYSLVSYETGEFYLCDLAVDMALESYDGDKEEITGHLREMIATHFLNTYYKTKDRDRKELTVSLTKHYADLLTAVEAEVTSPWHEGGEQEFFKVFSCFYPDGGVDYFRKNFAQYFSAPLAASY